MSKRLFNSMAWDPGVCSGASIGGGGAASNRGISCGANREKLGLLPSKKKAPFRAPDVFGP